MTTSKLITVSFRCTPEQAEGIRKLAIAGGTNLTDCILGCMKEGNKQWRLKRKAMQDKAHEEIGDNPI
jgi:hypothetical protein